jgi:hypothetical protein
VELSKKKSKSYYYYIGQLLCRPLKANVVRIPPVVNLFTLNKYSGKTQSLFFNFSITANGGRNIFWSILRDGSNTPLYSGNSQTVNGVSTRERKYYIKPFYYRTRFS